MNRTTLPRRLVLVGTVLASLGALALLLDGQLLQSALIALLCVVLLGVLWTDRRP